MTKAQLLSCRNAVAAMVLDRGFENPFSIAFVRAWEEYIRMIIPDIVFINDLAVFMRVMNIKKRPRIVQ